MARIVIQIGEVLKLTPNDIKGHKTIIRDPKSGRRKLLDKPFEVVSEAPSPLQMQLTFKDV